MCTGRVKKLVHLEGGSAQPANETRLVVFQGGAGEQRLQFRFVPVEGAGKYGYIEHVPSGKVVHPQGGSITPGNGTELVLHSDRHAGALFTFDEANDRIIHRDGKLWHPWMGNPNPADGTRVVLDEGKHDVARFSFTNASLTKISPYKDA